MFVNRLEIKLPDIPMKTNEERRIVAYLDSVQARLASRKGMISLRELQSTAGEELRPFFGRTLLPSVPDKVFYGEL
jgi:hypothetical protein